ncbi:MAG: ATP-binding protein, partial [Bryobacterales bacterium]|nr:ATP-binding protein [Bryobacterales bacterium]
IWVTSTKPYWVTLAKHRSADDAAWPDRASPTCYGRWLCIKMDSALNTPFSEWGNILFNTTIATAIADRLVENSEIFLLGGESMRKPKHPQPPAEPS